MASAGRVLLISKGAWVSGTSYSPMDFVYYGGNSYVCKAAVFGSTVPSSDTTHWQLMASGFDATLITQTITNDADKIASDAAVYTECQKLESNFAVIQASNVATQAFAIGDYLTYQGELYKVTSAIANGGTITPGTNCTKTNVGTQLDALNDSLMPMSVKLDVSQRKLLEKEVTTADGWDSISAGTNPSLSGYTFVGYIFRTTNSIAIGVSFQFNSGDVWFYKRSTGTATIQAYPLFVKNS